MNLTSALEKATSVLLDGKMYRVIKWSSKCKVLHYADQSTFLFHSADVKTLTNIKLYIGEQEIYTT